MPLCHLLKWINSDMEKTQISCKKMTEQNNEKDPLLDELEERIAEGPVIFTPDEEFLKLVEERRKKKNEQKD